MKNLKRITTLDTVIISLLTLVSVIVLFALGTRDLEPYQKNAMVTPTAPTLNLSERAVSTTTTVTTTTTAKPVVTTTTKKTTKKTTTTRTTQLSNNGGGNSKTVRAEITHYCACVTCNGKKWSWCENGINYTDTKSGLILHDGMSGNYCAASFGKIGDILTINGVKYKLVDRMAVTSGYYVDIFIAAGHDRCYELGRYHADVKIN